VPTVYLDEHFGTGIAEKFRRDGTPLGIQAEEFAAHRAKLPFPTDPAHLQFAAQQGWIVITRDKDFVNLHDLWHVFQLWQVPAPPLQHAGVLFVESTVVPDDEVVDHVLGLLGSPRHPDLTNRLLVLASRGIWLMHQPFAQNRRRRVQL
jgi:hypothetical protein